MSAYDQPIPMHRRAPTAGNYEDIPIALSDSRFNEPLVDARRLGIAGENYYARTDGRNTPYDEIVPGAVRQLWCRKSISVMLVAVNERLASYGAELYLWDALGPWPVRVHSGTSTGSGSVVSFPKLMMPQLQSGSANMYRTRVGSIHIARAVGLRMSRAPRST
jgi:hypothetical protein